MLLLLYVRLGIYNCWYAQTREQMLHSKNYHHELLRAQLNTFEKKFQQV